MSGKEEQWDPSRDIARGSVSANAALLFGGDAFVKKGGKKSPKSVSSPPRPPPQSAPPKDSDQAKKEPAASPSGGGSDEVDRNGGDVAAAGDQWDPSREIAAGSVSANAAKLFGAGGALSGAGGTKTKKGGPTSLMVAKKKGEEEASMAKEKEAAQKAEEEAMAEAMAAKKKAEYAKEEADVAAKKKMEEEAVAATKKAEEEAAMAKEEAETATKKAEEEALAAKEKAEEVAAKAKEEAGAAAIKMAEEEAVAAKKKADEARNAKEAAAEAKKEADAAVLKKKAEEEVLAAKKKAEEQATAAKKAEKQALAAKKKAEEQAMAATKKAEEAAARAKEEAKAALAAKKKAEEEAMAAKMKAEEVLAKANASEAARRKKHAADREMSAKLAQLQEAGSDLLLGRFDVSGSRGQPMRCTDNEILIRAVDVTNGVSGSKLVVLQLLSNPKRLESELQARSPEHDDDAGDTKPFHIVRVLDVLCDTSESVPLPSRSPFQVQYMDGLAEEVRTLLRTHGDSSQYDASGDEYGGDPRVTDDIARYPCLLVLDNFEQTLESHTDRFPRPNLRLARGVAADVVVGLMLLHTEGKVHRDLSPRRIVRCVGDVEDYSNDSDSDVSDSGATGLWKIAGLGSCGHCGEVVHKPGDLSGDWGYLPPEAAAVIVEGDKGEGDRGVTTDTAWDLWALGCVLYRLVFGSDLWTISRGGRISDEDLRKLSNWSKPDIWKRAAASFPPNSRTDGERAAIDLVAKLLAPTSEERMKNFEFGIISVHQHEFVEGTALEPASLASFRATQDLVAVEDADRARYHTVADKLSLEESWELSRARNVLLLGAFEPIEVHVPTSFIILKRPLSADHGRDEAALKEGMRWASVLAEVGPFVRGALLRNDVGSVGRFWAHIHGLYRGNYVYFYWVDDMTGEPVMLPPGQKTIGHGVPYPIPIKTRSDVLPKLLPLMHLTMRSTALYHGATGIARLFGGGSNPSLSMDVRQSAQGVVDDLKDEHGDAASWPFGSFLEDVSRARENRERFLRDEGNVRCRSLRELVRFYERKGVVVLGQARGEDDFVGLKRLADDEGLALWTLLDGVDEFRAAIKKRAEERLKEEKNLWGDSMEARIVGLEFALAESEAKLEAAEKASAELETRASAVEDTKESKMHIHALEKALAVAKEDQVRTSKADGQTIASLQSTLRQTMRELDASQSTLKQTMAELEASKKKAEALEQRLELAIKSRTHTDEEGSVPESLDSQVVSQGAATLPKTKSKMKWGHKAKKQPI